MNIVHKRRRSKFEQAAHDIEIAGFALTLAIHITWSACLDGVGRNVLSLPENERVKRIWRSLRRIARKHGVPFLVMRAPENDQGKALHLHMSAHLPNAAVPDVIRMLERYTGTPADVISDRPQTLTYHGRRTHGVWARGHLGAWMVQANTRPGRGGTAGFLRYVTKAPKSAETRVQFRLSNDLLRMVGK